MIHGIITHPHSSRKTDFLFRISIKGVIKNSRGEVLVVKEAGRNYWDLPGGGMDHNEDIHQAIARELREEVMLTGDFTEHILVAENPAYLDHINLWQVRLVFAIHPESSDFKPGEDGDEVIFIDPLTLKNSHHSAEQRVYEYSLLG